VGPPVGRVRLALLAAAVLAAACGAPSDHANENVLLRVSGTGTQTTQSFTASTAWSITWSFDCGAGSSGSLFVDIYNASDHTPDFKNRGIVAEGEQAAADTSRFANPGAFYLQVTTTCAWTIKVFELAR